MTNVSPFRRGSGSHDDELLLPEELETLYQEYSNETPSSDIGRQIRAAAERELVEPNKRQLLALPWWKKLILPLYAACAFAFTAIATNWFWPAPVQLPPGTSSAPVVIDMSESSKDVSEPDRLKQHKKSEQKVLILVTYPQLEIEPEQPVDKEKVELLKLTDSVQSSLELEIQQEIDSDEIASEKVQQKAQSKVAKVQFPDKESWSRDIIRLMREGEFISAQKELAKFKKVYPGYPIDEQIESFRQ